MSFVIKTFEQLEDDYNNLQEEEDVEKFFKLATTFLEDIKLYSGKTKSKPDDTNKLETFLNDYIDACNLFVNKRNRKGLLTNIYPLQREGVFELVKIYDVFEDINQETTLELTKYTKLGNILKESKFVKDIDNTIRAETKYPRPFAFIEASAGRGKTQIGQTLYRCCSTTEFKYIYVHFGPIGRKSQTIYTAFKTISEKFTLHVSQDFQEREKNEGSYINGEFQIDSITATSLNNSKQKFMSLGYIYELLKVEDLSSPVRLRVKPMAIEDFRNKARKGCLIIDEFIIRNQGDYN